MSFFNYKNKRVYYEEIGEGKPILWFDESQQVISFLKEKKYSGVNLIGTSGGALVAINTALEAPELVDKVIADSFQGEKPLKDFTKNIIKDRELSKQDKNAQMFYKYMQGEDWKNVVDNDTKAVFEHERTIGKFFHKPLETFQPPILLTGSKEDELLCSTNPNYFQDTYKNMVSKIGHGEIYLFESGHHPAMISNKNEFVELSKRFFEE